MSQIYGGAKSALEDRIKQVKKGYTGKRVHVYNHIERLASRNRLHWDLNANGLLQLFVHDSRDENLMDAAIKEGNIWKVIELAYGGIVTESCLMAFMKLRKVYWEFKQEVQAPSNVHETLFRRRISTEKFLN